ncbi:MAG TPA: hypothetical protein VFA70_08635 [Dehalococcoidia bacterium]|nr:hypothetical protein [Dehalococcoidia bacterium]
MAQRQPTVREPRRKDDERRCAAGEARIALVMSRFVLRRLARA